MCHLINFFSYFKKKTTKCLNNIGEVKLSNKLLNAILINI